MQKLEDAKRQKNINILNRCRYASLRLFLLCFLLSRFLLSASAQPFVTSVDDEIRRNYNPSKLEQETLPALPKILQSPEYTPPKQVTPQKKIYASYQAPQKQMVESYICLKKGTKIKVRALNSLSDRTRRGTRVSFVSIYPVSTTYYTIPSGTLFKGEVLSSHRPQFTSNGGLLKIKITSANINNSVLPINAKITRVNSKMIFLNNIKGQRKFAKNTITSLKPGCNFFKRMLNVTYSLAQDSSSVILTPFSVASGVLAFGGNVILSPVMATFKKGGPVIIPEGSIIDIKLIEDTYIYK